MSSLNKIVQECKRFVAFAAYDKLCGMEQTTLTDCEKKMEELFHGKRNDADSVGFTDLFCQARMEFDNYEDLFEEHIKLITDSLDTSKNASITQITLQMNLTRDTSRNWFIGLNKKEHDI